MSRSIRSQTKACLKIFLMKIFCSKNFSWISFGILLACSLYVFLCAVHYVRGRPLWTDEECVFRSVAFYEPVDFFTKRLEVDQIFPRLYLLTIQKVAQPLGLSAWGVRLLPFVSMLLAFFVWFKIARREFKEGFSFLMFCLCWAASIPLIYYSAELKQYSMDVLAAGIFVLFLSHQESWAQDRLRQGGYLATLVLLPVLGLFSYPAFLFLIFPLYNMIKFQPRTRGQWICLASFSLSAVLAVACLYFFDMRITKANVHTQSYQDYSISFQTVPEFLRTLGEGTLNLFSRWFVEQPRAWKRVALFFTVPGLIYIPVAFFRNFKPGRRIFDSVEKIAFILYLELFLLGALGKYPFSVPRTSLFYCPIVFLMTIKAMAGLRTWQPWVGRALQAFFMIFLIVVSAGIVREVLSKPLGAIHPIW